MLPAYVFFLFKLKDVLYLKTALTDFEQLSCAFYIDIKVMGCVDGEAMIVKVSEFIPYKYSHIIAAAQFQKPDRPQV